jgi:hypothetical protein
VSSRLTAVYFNEAEDLKAGSCRICEIKSHFGGISEEELELKNKRTPWKGKRYYLIEFTIRVIIGPADLKFESWFKNKKYNDGHDLIKIEWDSQGAAARPQSSEGHFAGPERVS